MSGNASLLVTPANALKTYKVNLFDLKNIIQLLRIQSPRPNRSSENQDRLFEQLQRYSSDTMTAINMPLTSQDEKEVSQTRTTPGCSRWAIAVLISMLTLVVFAGFVLYATVSCIAPSSDLPVHDLNFKAHGWLGDNEFDEDFHYDQENNVLVKMTTGQGSMDNATVLHDFKMGFTTYVIPSQKKCFLGLLESDSYDMLLHANNGGFMELSNPMGRQYISHDIISPSYLERTASPLVIDRCSGLETSWIEPSTEGASMQKRRAIRNVSRDIVIITPDGTIIIIQGRN